MVNADRYRLQLLFTYLFICYTYLFIYLFIPLSPPPFLYWVYLIPFSKCISPFTTSRIAFIHHIVKQINYCSILLSDIVHVMLYTAQ